MSLPSAIQSTEHEAQAQRQQSVSDQSLSSRLSTDYESAVSHLETEDEAQQDDTESITTLQRPNDTQDDDEPATDLTATAESAQDDQVAQNPRDLTDLVQYPTKRSTRSITSRHSLYESPVQEFDPETPANDTFELALQRTLSRKAILGGAAPEDELDSDDGLDARLLDWDSPDDKDNPQNWSLAKKWLITMVTASICLEVTFGSSLYVCGVPDLVVKMGISEELAISGLTFYLLGLAFGPVLGAPMSEMFGRRIVYITSLPISMLFTMGVGLSSHIRSVLVLRFFAGFLSSPAMAIAGGTIADMWNFEMIGVALSGFCLAPFMGPVLGPVIGGFVAEAKGWKWTMWVNLMFAGVILVPVLLTPETYKPVILKKRAKKRGIKLAKIQQSPLELIKLFASVTLMTPLKMLFVEPIVMVFAVYVAFVFAVLFGFFEAYPVIFRGVYFMRLGPSGLTFLGIMIGFILGTAIYLSLDRYVWFKKNPDGTRGNRDSQGKLIIDAPETRLITAKIGAVCLPISLFWLGWSSKKSVHWICPVIAGVPFGMGLLLIFFCVITYTSMAYPPMSLASALAANNLLRYVLASVFPLFTVQMYHRLGIDWASSLFAFIALAMVPVPWVFDKWGAQLRQRSQYGYAAMIKKQQEENVVVNAKLAQKTHSVSSMDYADKETA